MLVNNAGALFNRRQETEDGLEMTFALNHMAYFVITNILLPRLQAGARIVTRGVQCPSWRQTGLRRPAVAEGLYRLSVLFQVQAVQYLVQRELARRTPPGVTANALHPGFVATRFGDNSGGLMRTVLKVAKPIGAISPEKGAKTIVYLVSSPEIEGVNGEYFYECKPAAPTRERAERTPTRGGCGRFRRALPASASAASRAGTASLIKR